MMNTEILLTIKLQQQLFVDPKRVRLLKEIKKSGSINQAAKNAKVSYKCAWDNLAAMNEISPLPLLERSTGGKNGGGTLLTTYADRLLQLYDLLEQTQEKAFHILQDENIPLNSLLTATAHFSLQSSARNQLFGKVKQCIIHQLNATVEIELADFPQPIYASITKKSAEQLQLSWGREVMLMIKAPWVKLQFSPTEEKNVFSATVKAIENKGDTKEALLALNDHLELCAVLSSDQHTEIGQAIWLKINPEQIILATLY
ncbi:molybdenum-dependent transcriptional regulator [Pasteurellaceae bacterium Pebbles2]|nr:molybdenum-dependent transcriptional regulator [Pasteurellaceae bacterium Pebbles2]